jgi:acylpyruvate hydrolase
MLMATYERAGEWRAALRTQGALVDAARAAERAGVAAPQLWSDPMRALVTGAGEREDVLRAAEALRTEAATLAGDVRLGPPVPRPEKILCVGHNYRDHAAETKRDLPKVPVIFAKFRNGLLGPHDEVPHPGISEEIDYEGELAVVIGKTAKNLPAREALDAVAGYMVLNDLSARDLQRSASQWTAGKALDGFAPCGPHLLTADEVPDPQALRLTTTVNGVVRQDASTAEMIFSVAEILAYLTSVMTLRPGDVVATGTPGGVGMALEPQQFLAPGDVVEVSILGLGATRNRIGPRPEVTHV